MDAGTGDSYGTSMETAVQDTFKATAGAGAVCRSVRVIRGDKGHGLQDSCMARS